jgi:hypothetical protein
VTGNNSKNPAPDQPLHYRHLTEAIVQRQAMERQHMAITTESDPLDRQKVKRLGKRAVTDMFFEKGTSGLFFRTTGGPTDPPDTRVISRRRTTRTDHHTRQSLAFAGLDTTR